MHISTPGSGLEIPLIRESERCVRVSIFKQKKDYEFASQKQWEQHGHHRDKYNSHVLVDILPVLKIGQIVTLNKKKPCTFNRSFTHSG